MSQKINEIGTIILNQEKNVVFQERAIRNITLIGTESVSVEYEKIAKEGSKFFVDTIPYESFNQEVEGFIWNLIDNLSQKE